MEFDGLRDACLRTLVASVGLDAPASYGHWEWLLQCRLPFDVYHEFRLLREACNSAISQNDPDVIHSADRHFFEFAASDETVCRLMLAGRLAYYDRLLPITADAVRQVPHDRIVDVGCFAGLTTLFLARTLPDSEVVGIEKNAGAVAVANSLLAQSGLKNASFVHADFTSFQPSTSFDVVVSLQTVSAYYLPVLRSASPEHFDRGENLQHAATNASPGTKMVEGVLSSLRALVADSGFLFLHERIPDLPRALLFHFLSNKLRMDLLWASTVTWLNPCQTPRLQSSPFLVMRASSTPLPFDETVMISLNELPHGFANLTGLPADQVVTWQGHEAHANFHRLPGERDDFVVRLQMRDGALLNCHFGVRDSQHCYVYLCDTTDNRKLMVADTRLITSLFGSTVNEIRTMLSRGEVSQMEPSTSQLDAELSNRFARFAT